MSNDMYHVVSIGQFPPPVSGFSYITARLTDYFSRTSNVVRYHIGAAPTSTGITKHAFRLAATLRACRGLFFDRGRPNRVCYVACEGNLGLVYTLLVLITARVFRWPTALHHHSFSYIDKPHLLMYAVLLLGGDFLHIFLCAEMKSHFERRYGRNRIRGCVLSNAAFVEAVEEKHRELGSTFVLGHLSNLTKAKGLYLYLELLRQALAAGLPVRGILAGPAYLDEDRAEIERTVSELGDDLNYLGPIFDTEKDQFYRALDVFVFPSQYANEAQPTVIFEAKAAGNLVLSIDRGCIAAQVGSDGLVLERDSEFIKPALSWLKALIEDRGTLVTHSANARSAFIDHQSRARQSVDSILESIAKSATSGPAKE